MAKFSELVAAINTTSKVTVEAVTAVKKAVEEIAAKLELARDLSTVDLPGLIANVRSQADSLGLIVDTVNSLNPAVTSPIEPGDPADTLDVALGIDPIVPVEISSTPEDVGLLTAQSIELIEI